jgi:hypothetical protein
MNFTSDEFHQVTILISDDFHQAMNFIGGDESGDEFIRH